MSLVLRHRPPQLQPQVNPEHGSAEPPESDHSSRSVLVNYGIHRGSFPIAGMRIRDARQVLARLMNIDPSAVAVINGEPILEEDQVIGDAVQVLHFVKPSSVKGGQ